MRPRYNRRSEVQQPFMYFLNALSKWTWTITRNCRSLASSSPRTSCICTCCA
jgi:hypothetical protein